MPTHDVIVNGVALNDMGLTETNTVNGYGLLTFGLLWECREFWYGPYFSTGASITTGWSAYSGLTLATTWSLYVGMTLTTTWSLCTTSDQSCTDT